jgi:hypothetical protein
VQSLADYLGVVDSKEPDRSPGPAPSKRVTAKSFALEILTSQEYRQSIHNRIILGDLPPQLECLLYHYAYGKPVERVEVTDVPFDHDDLTIEQLEERALRTLEFVRRHRREPDEETGAIH